MFIICICDSNIFIDISSTGHAMELAMIIKIIIRRCIVATLPNSFSVIRFDKFILGVIIMNLILYSKELK